VRNFERAVVRGLGIDQYPELLPAYFQNYTDLLYLVQFADDRLVAKAGEIGQFLHLPLEVRHVGLGQLETWLAALVEAAP
jgi:site-specific recombinase